MYQRFLLLVLIALALIFLVTSIARFRGQASSFFPAYEPHSGLEIPVDNESHRPDSNSPGSSHLNPLNYLNGPPTISFKDNLKTGERYITSWVSAGWTNDVMTYGNLLYLALITDRIPVFPMFTPSHIGGNVRPIDFGQIFDVPRLRSLLGKPVLEWHEVKDPQSEQMDSLGCWNVWQAVQYNEAHPRPSTIPERLKLDISYTKLPDWIKTYPGIENDPHASFWALARFGFPDTRQANLGNPVASEHLNLTVNPDEQMLCYDYLYYVCAHQAYEYDYDYSPAWRYAMQFIHFTPALEQLADAYVRRAIGVEHSTTTPPFIAIHVRHADFKVYCEDIPLDECYASLPVISRRVEEVRREIQEKKGIHIEHVIMTSDERNETWWQEVESLGWKRLHHLKWAGVQENTSPVDSVDTIAPIPGAPENLEKFAEWFPLLLDATVQSRGLGFVGTDRSTMSMIAKRRVETWLGGISRTVKWGRPDSDDH